MWILRLHHKTLVLSTMHMDVILNELVPVYNTKLPTLSLLRDILLYQLNAHECAISLVYNFKFQAEIFSTSRQSKTLMNLITHIRLWTAPGR